MWYVIYSKPRQEKLALENLQRQGFCCYLPMLQREVVVRGKKQIRDEVLFSRYLFLAELQSDQGLGLAPVRSTKGVSHMLQFAGKQAQVSDQWVQGLKASLAVVDGRPISLFSEGQRLQVSSGPFSGYEVFYACQDGEQRAQVLINMLGKMQQISLPVSQLKTQ